MITDNSIYEVSRGEYKGFVEQIKPEYKRVETIKIDDIHQATKIFSTNTNKCLCSRLTYIAEYGTPEPEKYYIFEIPDDDELLPPTPHVKIELKTKEEVQAFFDNLKKLQNNNND
jgi:hypothetical protein